MSDYPGLYQGVVVDNNDPERRGRVTLQVPQVFGDATTTWCEPNLPTISKRAIGEVVYVQFINGDIAKPVFHSAQALEAEDIRAGTISAEMLDFEPGISTLSADVAPTTRADGSALSNGDLWIDTANGNRINRWSTSATPNAWVPLPVGSNAISPRQILGTHIDYNQIDTPHLVATLVLGSTITTRQGALAADNKTILLSGLGVDLSTDGFFAYDGTTSPDGTPGKHVEIPTDPGSPARFRGNAEFDTLTVDSFATLADTQIAQNRKVTLQQGIVAPGNRPAVTFSWQSVQHGSPDGKISWADRTGLAYDGANWYTVGQRGSDGVLVEKWDSTGNRVAYFLIDGTAFNRIPCGIVYDGSTYLYTLHQSTSVSSGDASLVFTRFNPANLSIAANWSAIHPTTAQVEMPIGSRRRPGLAYDPGTGQMIVAQSRQTNGDKVRFQRVTLGAGGAVTWATTALDSASAYASEIASCLYGSFDLGAPYYLVGNYGSSAVQAFNPTTGNRDTTVEWDYAATGSTRRGTGYDGTNFWSIDSTGNRSRYESGNKWTAAADGTWYVAYTWRNATNLTETPVGTPYPFTMKKRAKVTVTTAALPLGVSEARIYYAKGTAPNTTSGLSTMTLAGSTSGSTQPSRTDANVLFTPANDPVNPLSFFPTGTPASLVSVESATTPLINLKGNGAGRVGPLSWDASGNVLTQPTPPSDPTKLGIPITNSLAATFSTTSSTYVSSGLSLSAVAPGTYLFKVRGSYQSSATTTGIGIRVGGTAATSSFNAEVIMYSGQNSSTSPVFSRVLTSLGQTAASSTGVQAANTSTPFTIEGTITVTAQGTISTDIVSQDGVGTVRLMAGAMIYAFKIA